MFATPTTAMSARILRRVGGLSLARPAGWQLQSVRGVMLQKLKSAGTGGKKKDKSFIPQHILKKQQVGQVEFNKEELLAREPETLAGIQVITDLPMLYFHDILTYLREINMADMNNNEDGLVQMHIEMDFRTDRMTKFKANFSKTVTMPYNFKESRENRVLVFCETDEQKKIALDAGAAIAGDSEIITAVEKGEISSYEFTHAVSTPAMFPLVNKIRKILKDKHPQARDGTLGEDIEAMVTHFRLGKTFTTATEMGPELGSALLRIGPLNMLDEELRANLMTYLDHLKREKSYKTKDYGPFIQKAIISVQGCSERFLLHLPTAGLDREGIAAKLEEDLAAKNIEVEEEQTREEQIEAMPVFQSEEERQEWLAQQKEAEWQQRIQEQRGVVDMVEKQLKAYRLQKKRENEAKKRARDEHEAKLREAYRLRRLERLSPRLQRDIDLDSQYRKPLHI